METCDVLIVGGGPGGSTCAWRLVRAGLDVVVVDGARFPREKLCAGWITPQLFETLRLRPGDYADGRTLQAITGFRTAVLGRPPVTTRYPSTVSFAIRRSEFDAYLLERSRARLHTGTPVRSVRREATGGWVLDDRFAAPVLVAAGGHFCPVARSLFPRTRPEPAVVAREIEFRMDAAQQAACPVESHTPELYFTEDLSGYGWLVRKGQFLNVGYGCLGAAGLSRGLEACLGWMTRLGRLPPGLPPRWAGHAYFLWDTTPRLPVADGVLLVGDAAGLAAGRSGEGIRQAAESGLMAAETLIEAGGVYTRDRLDRYEVRLTARFGARRQRGRAVSVLPGIRRGLAGPLLETRWFTRRILLDRWFLQRRVPAL